MRFHSKPFILTVLMASLNGCAGSGGGFLGIGAVVGDRNLASAEPLFSKEEQGCLGSADQLIAIVFGPDKAILPDNRKSKNIPGGPDRCTQIKTNFRYMLSPAAPGRESLTQYNTAQRNEVIDALLASSNRKCTRYTALLKNADGAMNAGLSVGAILTGGLGSILGGAATAKALAGSSSILSGSRAALNETYLSNQTIHVLTSAFEKARRTQRRQITNREACSVDQYTLMRGIEDAFAYHDSCSIIAGLAETSLSIERSENPGMDAMRLQLNELANLRRQASEFAADGPITPIRSSPTPASLDKLVAADKALIEAEDFLSKEKTAQQAAEQDVSTKEVELAAKSDGDKSKETTALADARKKLDSINAAVVKLTNTRDKAGQARNAQVQALVRNTVGVPAVVDPETRICPFT